MHFLLRLSTSHRHIYHHRYHQNYRTLYEAASTTTADTTKWVRDRGLDHAVLREKNLKPVINLKNLIKSEPSKSVPLSIITSSKDSLQLPIRPIEFIRKYSSIFEEFFPGNITIHPHVKLTSQALNLDVEENLLYQSVDYKQDIADRLLKLLMIGRINKIPLSILDKIKWELGLPQDFVKSIVPEFPDYFTVSKGKVAGSDEMLELVCWSDELAVSSLEKKAKKHGVIEFPLKYTTGFEMEKKDKKWVDDWQKLPYISPYENSMHLEVKNDDSDKWAVSVLHEMLNLFVGKKAEKESVLFIGEFFGLRSRFKRAILQHPGIFYVSSKNWMHTVVLRDGYKRGALSEKDVLMDMRFKYARVMNTVKEEEKGKSVKKKSTSQKAIQGEGDEEEVVKNSSDEDEDEDEEMCDEDEDEEMSEDEDSEDENAKNKRPNLNNKGRLRNKTTFEENRGSRTSRKSSNPREITRFSRTKDGDEERVNEKGRVRNRTTFDENRGSRNFQRTEANPRFSRTDRDDESAKHRGSRTFKDKRGSSDFSRSSRTNSGKTEERMGSRNFQRTGANPRFSRTDRDDESAKHRGRPSNNRGSSDFSRSSGTNSGKTEERMGSRFSRNSNRDGQNLDGRSRERSQVPRSRGSSAST